MSRRARTARAPRCRVCWALWSVSWVLSCLPSQGLSSYSSGRAEGSEPSSTRQGEPQGAGSDGDAGASSSGELLDPDLLAPGAPDSSDASAGSSETGGPRRADAGPPPIDGGNAPPASCAAGERLGAEGNCHFIELLELPWDDARARCRARGAGWDLTVVRSLPESKFLAEQLADEAWIGATDGASEGNWVWVTDATPFWAGDSAGSPVDGAYANWNATEPNGSTTTNCARALPDSFGSSTPNAPWADLPCDQLRGSVCESHGAAP